MKKISWIRRLFWSWQKFENYFLKESQVTDETKAMLIKFNDELKKDKDKLIAEKDQINSKNFSLENKLHKIEYENKASKNSLTKDLQKGKERNQKLISEIGEQKIALEEIRKTNQDLKFDISKKLSPMDRIEKTFFAQTGNVGKGKFGELQLENVLSKSGLPKDFWTKNLVVEKNRVEFAIKSGYQGKWIPIDSKVIDLVDDENYSDENKGVKTISVDQKYVSKVKTQVNEITKYLAKENTASYGVLVLQSDNIYMKLYDEFPEFFQEMIAKKKVYIASPSSFIQMAWSISEIVNIYDKVKGDEKIYDQVLSALDSVAHFANNLSDAKEKLNMAMDKHFPILQNKHQNLKKILDSSVKKIKDVKNK